MNRTNSGFEQKGMIIKMDINVYRTYSFTFNKDEYINNFKKALCNAGVNSPASFSKLLKNVKDYDYETVKSYFYGRRVPPMEVFIATCKSLHFNADAIAFPNSVQVPAFSEDICGCEDLFRNIFHPYNPSEDGGTPDDLTEFFDAETYESDVDYLALILARYNYLIQKYHYAAVSNDELMQISYFTERYIIDRAQDGAVNADEVTEWIRNCEDEEFLGAFYDKYTIGFYNKSCRSLLDVLTAAIDKKFTGYAEQLLPYRDIAER